MWCPCPWLERLCRCGSRHEAIHTLVVSAHHHESAVKDGLLNAVAPSLTS